MKKRTRIHVLYVAKRGWVVKISGTVIRDIDGEPYYWFVKSGAVASARQDAMDLQPSSLYIHGRDGKIQEERTYPRSSDPSPPKG